MEPLDVHAGFALDGMEISVSSSLAGCKHALRLGREPKIYVSPAMYDLMKNANEDELRTLLANIPVKHLPFERVNPFRLMEDFRLTKASL